MNKFVKTIKKIEIPSTPKRKVNEKVGKKLK
jgi:hypothetical protein